MSDNQTPMSPGKAHFHLPRLVKGLHVHGTVHGHGLYGRFNARLAVWVTNKVGTMTCAYLFTVIALIGLPASLRQAQTDGPLPVVQWIAQTFLQLVLLSVIMVGQRVIGEGQDARAEADHETLTALHALTKQVNDLTTENAKVLGRLHELASRNGGGLETDGAVLREASPGNAP
jgi:hypothetical protein